MDVHVLLEHAFLLPRSLLRLAFVRRRRLTGRNYHQYPRPMAKPDLIELSTDWDRAVLVADRYTGLNDGYIMEQAKQLLAALLLIANKEGRDYESVSAALQNQWHILEPIQRELWDRP